MSDPSSKVALVTGSGKRRVGHAIVEALARRGFRIAVHYHTSADEARETVLGLKEQGCEAQAFQADLSRPADVERLLDDVVVAFGRLDVLVNSASIYHAVPLEQITAEDLLRNFEVNAMATFLCGRKAGLIMAAQREGGVIINLGDWAIERPYPGYTAYMISKGTIPTLTRALAVELAQRNPNVRVNCIHPGPVLFPVDMPEDIRLQAIAGTLVKRPGRPEHVAQAVLFLVDNDYVTGVCLPVDGGRTIAAAQRERAE